MYKEYGGVFLDEKVVMLRLEVGLYDGRDE
jgi:hypothetical protein